MEIEAKAFADKPSLYGYLLERLPEVRDADRTADLANTAALLYHLLPGLNWAGFYLLKDGGLVLGPFQGRPAVTRIALGKGVCGEAAAAREARIVKNVHECENHIACDLRSSSEIVIPLFRGAELEGVLDLDSPQPARFDAEDQIGLTRLTAALARPPACNSGNT